MAKTKKLHFPNVSHTEVDPFAVASEAVAPSQRSDGDIIFADALFDRTTKEILYPKNVIEQAVMNYAKGKRMADDAEALMSGSRKPILEFGMDRFAEMYVAKGSRPANPKIFSDAEAHAVIGMSFLDSHINLEENQYVQLEMVVGSKLAKDLVEKFDQFSFNTKVLSEKVKVEEDGKEIEKTVQQLVAEALKTLPAGIASRLLVKKNVFRTKKGIIDRGLELVGKDVSRLVNYLKAADFTIQLKPQAAKGKDEK